MTVTIYTTTHCPFCKMAKEFFSRNNVKYNEKNVEDDQTAADEMIKKSDQMGVPVIDIDGKIIVGFDKKEIEKALHMA